MRHIDADALIPDLLVPTSMNNTLCKRYVSMEQIHNAPTIEPEITQEDIELYCRRRCLTVITDDLFNEMKMRWSAQPTQSNAPNTLDVISRQAAIDGKISIQRADGVEIYSDEAVPVEYLRALPSAQPGRKTGEWIRINENVYVCSLCNTKAHLIGYDAPSDYCHGCGAKMEVEG